MAIWYLCVFYFEPATPGSLHGLFLVLQLEIILEIINDKLLSFFERLFDMLDIKPDYLKYRASVLYIVQHIKHQFLAIFYSIHQDTYCCWHEAYIFFNTCIGCNNILHYVPSKITSA